MTSPHGGAEVGESSGGGAGGDGGGAGGDGGVRRWEDLHRDLLVTIFSKLSVADLISAVPFACTSWRDASRDPVCWRVLDFRDWGDIVQRLGCRREAAIDFADLLDFSIARSDDFLDSVYFPDFADDIDLLYVADRCPELLYFSIESPDLVEDQFCKAISKFEFLKGMAVGEHLIDYAILQHVEQCCPYLSELKIFADTVCEDVASTVCECLPFLRKLEITDCGISRQAILTFLEELKELEYFDISGYENSGITGLVLEKASHLKVFRWDSKYDEGEFEYCSECEEDWLSQNPCECVLDRKVMEWLSTLS